MGVKTISKIRELVQVSDKEWTHRHLAAILSTLLFASRVLNLSLAEYYRAFEIWRRFRPPQQSENQLEFWESTVTLNHFDVGVIKQWFSDVVDAPPANIVKSWKGQNPDAVLITDASKTHWAGLSIKGKTVEQIVGHSRCHSTASAVTEPWALYNAIMSSTSDNERLSIVVLTDNTGLVFAINKGFARSFSANRVASLLRRSRPLIRVFAIHVPGQSNIANDLSRGQDTSRHSIEEFVTWTGSSTGPPVDVRRVIVSADLPSRNFPYRIGKHECCVP